jgi:two-component system, cell cycle sensor histidine kinase and response regulator CckA
MTGESNVVMVIDLRTERDIVTVRQRAREIASHVGFDQQDQTRISTAASEIARNAFKYAVGGRVEFSFQKRSPEKQTLMIAVRDTGPGIPHLATILEGRFQSKTGLGKGILGANRLMDFFDIRTEPGAGTTVILEKLLPPGAPAVTASIVAKMVDELDRGAPRDPFAEVQYQNQELLRALQEGQTREAELARLHAILQRESDEAIRTREARLQGIISSAMDAIISVDEQQRIVVFNAAAEKMFLCNAAEALGSSFGRFTPEAFGKMYRECIGGFELSGINAQSMSSLEVLTARRLNGEEFPIEATVSQVEVAGQKLFTIILRDITERKRAESLEQQLQQANKMEALGRLAGGVAHDFNTLLNIMLGYSELLLSELPQGDRRRERAEQIEKSAQTGALLTKQLLAFSRKQPIAPKVSDLNQMVKDLEPMLRRLMREDIELEVHYSAEICPVKVDLSQMQQLVLNLAANARDAMPSGGNVTIDVQSVELDETYTHQHPSMAPGRYEMLVVSDSGVGMDRETVAHIFEPFFTTKALGKGTGLGLATVSGIVKQNGGDIRVDSEPGIGSIFRVYLPRSAEAVERTERVRQSPQKLSGNETILLVEDSAPLRKLTRELLSREGYVILEAVDGVDALKVSEQHPGRISLLITDIVMPRMRGTELAIHITAQRPDIAIVYLSGYIEDAVARLSDSRRIAILEKPYTSDTLLRTVRQSLDELNEITSTGR